MDAVIEERLEKIVDHSELTFEEARKEFEEIMQEDFIQEDPVFENEKEKQKYALRVLSIEVCKIKTVQTGQWLNFR